MNSIDEIPALLIEQRKKLKLEQKDMYMRIGMKQQQYQRIESGANVRLSTLLRVLEGLGLEMTISPKSNQQETYNTSATPTSQLSDLQDDSDDLEFWFGNED